MGKTPRQKREMRRFNAKAVAMDHDLGIPVFRDPNIRPFVPSGAAVENLRREMAKMFTAPNVEVRGGNR